MKLRPIRNAGAWLAIFAAGSPTGLLADDAPAPIVVAESVVASAGVRIVPEENVVDLQESRSAVRVQLAQFNGAPAAALQGTVVTLIEPNGKLKRFGADEQARVVFNAQTPGVYAVICSGPTGHAAFPVIVRTGSGKVSASDSAPTVLVPLFDLPRGEALRAVNSFLPPLSPSISRRDIDGDVVANEEPTQTRPFLINLSSGGRLEGQVGSLMVDDLLVQSLEGNNLLFFRDGKLVVRAISDAQGRFAVEGLSPGSYGIICVGPGGYAAFGFEAVQPNPVTATPSKETLVVKMDDAPPADGPFISGSVLPVLPIPLPMLTDLADILRAGDESELPVDPLAVSPIPGGGAAGFGAAGGGGGTGMGGAGGLLGLAALGAAVAAAASDSNDRVIINPTPNPSTPNVP